MNFNATLIGQSIAMVVFVWFCMKFVWPPIVASVVLIGMFMPALDWANEPSPEEIARAQRAQDAADASEQIEEIEQIIDGIDVADGGEHGLGGAGGQ